MKTELKVGQVIPVVESNVDWQHVKKGGQYLFIRTNGCPCDAWVFVPNCCDSYLAPKEYKPVFYLRIKSIK